MVGQACGLRNAFEVCLEAFRLKLELACPNRAKCSNRGATYGLLAADRSMVQYLELAALRYLGPKFEDECLL
jgi:hypothetical protein